MPQSMKLLAIHEKKNAFQEMFVHLLQFMLHSSFQLYQMKIKLCCIKESSRCLWDERGTAS